MRHGVKPDGRPVMIMPSEDYNRLTDADLGALVAYIRQLPPAAGGAAEVVLPLPLRVRYGRGQVPDAASVIDHQRKPSLPVAEGVRSNTAPMSRRCASAATARTCRAARFPVARRTGRRRRT